MVTSGRIDKSLTIMRAAAREHRPVKVRDFLRRPNFPSTPLVPLPLLCNREISRNSKSTGSGRPEVRSRGDFCASKCKRTDFSANYVTRQIAIVIYCYLRNFFLYIIVEAALSSRGTTHDFRDRMRANAKPWRSLFLPGRREGAPPASRERRTESKTIIQVLRKRPIRNVVTVIHLAFDRPISGKTISSFSRFRTGSSTTFSNYRWFRCLCVPKQLMRRLIKKKKRKTSQKRIMYALQMSWIIFKIRRGHVPRFRLRRFQNGSLFFHDRDRFGATGTVHLASGERELSLRPPRN